jgi:hypothetical protein
MGGTQSFRVESKGEAIRTDASRPARHIRIAFAAFLAVAAAGCSASSGIGSAAPSASAKVGYPGVQIARTAVEPKKAVARSTFSATKSAYLGRAPYICTPSGFGRTSKCFAR